MQDKIFTTTCINWDDGDSDAVSRSAKEAAEKHAAAGWMSDPPSVPECVTILVKRQPREILWVVVGDADSQTAARAPDYMVEALVDKGMI